MALELIKGEEILFIRRRHWFKFVVELFPLFVFGVVLAAAPIFAEKFFTEALSAYYREFFLTIGLIAQVVVLSAFLIAVSFYLDLWIVTNKRIVFIELHGLFSREVSSIDYMKVQDISVDVHGFFPTLLDFGNIQIETAGMYRPFIMKDVPRPYEIKDRILEVKDGVRN